MKTFEIFSKSKKGQNGRRKFKTILYKIQPDDCVVNGVGTEYNINGITWIRKYCEPALDSIKGMSLRCEFINDERTEIWGHGQTDIQDGVPLFENATVIGTFSRGYIDEIEDDNGEKITVCIGEGEIDSSCYHNFCEVLDENISNGKFPSGSIEIMSAEGHNCIEYVNGDCNEMGRIPSVFIHSGYALLGIKPSDDKAKFIELNNKDINKKEAETMNEVDIAKIARQVAEEMTNCVSEINQIKQECEAKIAELNSVVEAVTSEKNEINASAEAIQAALDECKAEFAELDKKYNALWNERNELEKALGEAKAKERVGELNSAIAEFSEAEKEYAKEEIAAFTNDPMSFEINSVVSKIYEGIGKKAKADKKADEQREAEINSANETVDIFGTVGTKESDDEVNIFD